MKCRAVLVRVFKCQEFERARESVTLLPTCRGFYIM